MSTTFNALLLVVFIIKPVPGEELPFLQAETKVAGPGQLAKLKLERSQAAQEELLLRHRNLVAGRGSIDLILNAAQRLANSRLEAAATKADRTKRLEEYVEYMKFVEKHCTEAYDKGRLAGSEVAQTKYFRSDAEIRLLQERAK